MYIGDQNRINLQLHVCVECVYCMCMFVCTCTCVDTLVRVTMCICHCVQVKILNSTVRKQEKTIARLEESSLSAVKVPQYMYTILLYVYIDHWQYTNNVYNISPITL